MLHRLLPIFALLLLSPLIAEYLSGSLPAALLTILWLMMAMYGAGALLIREIAVRTGGGWGTIIPLAAAHGFIEEGWSTQSLFNPNYQGLRLLDFGYVEALGTGLPWLLYVIGIHVVWSMATPIALTNSLFPEKRRAPWLRWWGMAILVLLYAGAMVAAGNYQLQTSHFVATRGELIAVGVVVAALVAGGLLAARWRAALDDVAAPGLLPLFLYGFLPGTVLIILEYFGPSRLHLSWQLGVVLLIADAALAIAIAVHWRGRRWTALQSFMPAAGATMVYAIGGFLTATTLHGAGDLPGHAAIALLCLAVLGLAWRRSAAFDRASA
ncbi:MAG: hypothetical protein J7494_14500 [Sphingobium sp.]|nr:hypothetical protein [Sphingobium sp.]